MEEKRWDEMTTVERLIANELFMIEHGREAAAFLRDNGYHVAAIMLKANVDDHRRCLDSLRAGEHDYLNNRRTPNNEHC